MGEGEVNKKGHAGRALSICFRQAGPSVFLNRIEARHAYRVIACLPLCALSVGGLPAPVCGGTFIGGNCAGHGGPGRHPLIFRFSPATGRPRGSLQLPG